MSGPLTGVRIIEIAGIGPGPFACMMLADQGADVIRVERPGGDRTGVEIDPATDILKRSRRTITVDLKSADGIRIVRDLAAAADGFVEGFRPGVMERLGLGPDVLMERNPRLVYGRMTGWGQDGPYGTLAGHDINYLALSGALHAFGRAGEKPTPPINIVGDYGGGGMMLAFGMVSALLHARRSGEGQVIDVSMTEGASTLMSLIWSLHAQGNWCSERGTNFLDTGAHFYDTYRTADGLYISIGAIEPQFYALLRNKLGLSGDPDFDAQMESGRWPALKAKLAALFVSRTRDEWCELLEGTDACFAPVLSMDEAPHHPHNRIRGSFVEVDGVLQPAPVPRYSRTCNALPRSPRARQDSAALLAELGFEADAIERLRAAGAFC